MEKKKKKLSHKIGLSALTANVIEMGLEFGRFVFPILFLKLALKFSIILCIVFVAQGLDPQPLFECTLYYDNLNTIFQDKLPDWEIFIVAFFSL